MLIKITARHMDVTDAIRSYVEKKLARVTKYYNRISEVEVILTEEGQGQRHKIEVIVRVDNHQPFVVHESGNDMYACVDLAVDKLERQLTKHKEKSRIHKGRTGAAEASADVLQNQEIQEEESNE